jgi:hypothetical protein
MLSFTDARVTWLYYTARGGEEPMINDIQRTAVSILGELARAGNSDAAKALDQLCRTPSLHPLLKEMVGEYHISTRTRGQAAGS